MLANIVDGFSAMLTPTTVILAFLGVLAGTLLGAIPGLTATMGIALILPVTFTLDPISGIVMLTAMYKGGLFGGSISAIMFNAPGSPAAAATAADGYAMRRKGYPRKAIRTALVASVTGDVFGNLVLIFSSAILATLALKFGPSEYTFLVIFALMLIITITTQSVAKNIISVVIGLLIATIGSDLMTAVPRLTFGVDQLNGGISIIALVIGLLAVSEVFSMVEEHFSKSKSKKDNEKDGDDSTTFKRLSDQEDNVKPKEFWDRKGTLLRSPAIGTAIGALPGLGPVTAAFVSYSQALKRGRFRKKIGKGEQEGIIAAESANSAVASANLIPLVTLGIPGDAEAAIIFGALIIHGIVPGPKIFETNGTIIYGIFAGMLLASLMCLIINWFSANAFRKISFIRPTILAPIILVLSVAGTYGYSQNSFDIILMFVFAIMGYVFKKIDVPLVGIIIGFVLGPTLEASIRQSLVVSGGDFLFFFKSPISIVFMILIAVLIVGSIINSRKSLKL